MDDLVGNAGFRAAKTLDPDLRAHADGLGHARDALSWTGFPMQMVGMVGCGNWFRGIGPQEEEEGDVADKEAAAAATMWDMSM
ncbi:hypothetical protein CLAFUW4_09875 [Fulvia fulva]|uniref:Uncharacterized protein n=1 Tax=Passalora fulva TaxID=5499 RepID=A0A9Q8UUE8_PASFU|nr:uncharacterized protein CLAFUR5_12364 [Fulvia fulva]KAK4615308.1 hypothetical protein CLAFUR4_09880 [Fulvia fulva]KAK4616872.1 hypothetical protein CLAFUR0_09874 [Fulvia fulva]UJO22823.1 hypothetical protein CLAFUR5_12364 [Fulvia fulva]WPV18720.1 hypothetical protein CLAFUW4_09875 [Fulvia fulva]WPV33746.1 hypothetical protein CLAFUW7_09877 [Fulvia fulva]